MKEQFSLQGAMTQLEEIEAYFNKPDMDLEVAIAKHKEALAVAAKITAYLDGVQSTLEDIEGTLPS